MIKVKIYEGNSETIFETIMPVLPKINEHVGIWTKEDKWVICEISQITYEFSDQDEFMFVEILCYG
jgi:hypothetical protein